MKTLTEIQLERRLWADAVGFGNLGTWEGVLGMQEELGELIGAIIVADIAEAVDAIGDLTLFALHYLDAKGWAVEQVLQNVTELDGPVKGTDPVSISCIVILLGKVAHAELKLLQGHRTASVGALTELAKLSVGRLLRGVWLISLSLAQRDLVDVTNEVWDRVCQRDKETEVSRGV